VTALAPLAALLLGLGGVDTRLAEAVAHLEPSPLAVVVLDVASGQVLAERGQVERPLPPGSTFKIVDVLAAATQPGALSMQVRCPRPAGTQGPPKTKVQCGWLLPGGHGELKLEEAVAASCNVYFGALGEAVGTPGLAAMARSLGVGVSPGQLPGDTAPAALVADGDGVRITALQLARLLRQVARGVREDGAPLADAAVLGRLRHGLRLAVTQGTAAAAASSIPVAGKTGTAALGSSRVGWFAGYAPADAPTLVVVIVERGRSGREVAGAAPALLEAFFHGSGAASGPGPGPGHEPGRSAPPARR
jgi:cell division protein FtsI/penicillin-binding protein 2